MIPHYFLYEEAAPKVEPSFLHIEPIPVRSGRHDWTIRTHSHPDHHQLLAISKGGGEIEIEGQTWELSPPALVIVPALTIHAIRFEPGTDGYVITVAPPFLQAALDGDPELVDGFAAPRRFLPQQIGEDIDLIGLFAALAHEFVWSAPGRRSAIKAYLQLLAVAVRRLRAQEQARPVALARDIETVMRFRELVEKHYRQHPPLDFYARRLGVTTARLNACCRLATGKSSLALINDRLITEAKRNLLYSDMTVNEIGAALGYEDPAYFNRFFARNAGLPPGRFRDSLIPEETRANGSVRRRA
ncbi:helix-turn-helix domain-containing protein [Bradyrhizobium oligotrophicum]|uniref:helix-turn-helix domain-containing protein n=1 Tax=Bradyrhizobium oligotrophicum TaxID=44255 RepID=UPI003EBD2ACA